VRGGGVGMCERDVGSRRDLWGPWIFGIGVGLDWIGLRWGMDGIGIGVCGMGGEGWGCGCR
jgi:hypothetical protein